MTFGIWNRRSQHSRKPKVLKGKDIPSLAEYIKSEECKNVILMVRWFASEQQWSLKPLPFWFQLGAGWSFVSCTRKILILFSPITAGTKESVRLPAFLILGHPRLVCHHSLCLLWNLIMLHIFRTIRMLHLLSFQFFFLIMSRFFGQSNLARLNLPHPEAVFEIGFFRRNPVPCMSYFILFC